jgi:polyisoprenoid-binding protein YceI
MKHIIFLLGFAAFLQLLSTTACAMTYMVDPAQSELVVRLFKAGIGSVLAHNHVKQATDFSGEAKIDFENPSASDIRVEAQAKSLRADPPKLRQKYELEKEMSDDDRRQVQETMLSGDQMDVQKYPTIRFESTGIEKQSAGQYVITGAMTIHGVTQSISFPAVVTREGDRIQGRGSFHFKQSDFGIKPYSAFFGTVRNQDEAVMNIDLVLVPPKTPAESGK